MTSSRRRRSRSRSAGIRSALEGTTSNRCPPRPEGTSSVLLRRRCCTRAARPTKPRPPAKTGRKPSTWHSAPFLPWYRPFSPGSTRLSHAALPPARRTTPRRAWLAEHEGAPTRSRTRQRLGRCGRRPRQARPRSRSPLAHGEGLPKAGHGAGEVRIEVRAARGVDLDSGDRHPEQELAG
jgi:hypothetical protein